MIAIGALAEPYFDWQSYRNHGLCYFNRAVGGLHGAAERGFEISYWFEAVTDQDWRNMIDQIPHKSTVFFRPDHPGIEDLISWKLWRRDIVITGDPQNADYLLLYAKPSFYSAPSQSVRTDLWRVQQEGPANYVLSAHGVRLLSLVATGRNTDKN